MKRSLFILAMFTFIVINFGTCKESLQKKTSNSVYLTPEYLEDFINDPTSDIGNIIFDKMKLDDVKINSSRTFLGSNMRSLNISQYYIEYKNNNIILLTEKIEEIEYALDLLAIEKKNDNSYLTSGQNFIIDEKYFDSDITILINNRWHRYAEFLTKEMCMAYKVNLETKRIEPFSFDTLRFRD